MLPRPPQVQSFGLAWYEPELRFDPSNNADKREKQFVQRRQDQVQILGLEDGEE